MAFFSLLLGVLSPIFNADDTFAAFLTNRMQEIDNWTLKIEKSVPDKFMPCGLYFNIRETVWVAMLYDYNMMIEEYDFYNQLPPRMQNALVNILYRDAIEWFEMFFDNCQNGFRNEFIVNMLCRMPLPGQEIFSVGDPVRHIYFIEDGVVSMQDHAKSKAPFVQFKQHSWIGDFQVLFNKRSNFHFKADNEITNMLWFFQKEA
jgi:hypothetical protein